MNKEVILNDECVHCNDKECHDGEHFCNQAMKENSFYKNAKLYKGLEVTQRPTYEELEKENKELKDYRLTTVAKQQTEMSKYALNLEHKLGWYDNQLTKAKELLKKFLLWENDWHNKTESKYELLKEAEQFLNSEVDK